MRVSEIRVNQIRVNQGLGVYEQIWIISCGNSIEQNKTKQFLVWSIGMIDIHSIAYLYCSPVWIDADERNHNIDFMQKYM